MRYNSCYESCSYYLGIREATQNSYFKRIRKPETVYFRELGREHGLVTFRGSGNLEQLLLGDWETWKSYFQQIRKPGTFTFRELGREPGTVNFSELGNMKTFTFRKPRVVTFQGIREPGTNQLTLQPQCGLFEKSPGTQESGNEGEFQSNQNLIKS